MNYTKVNDSPKSTVVHIELAVEIITGGVSVSLPARQSRARYIFVLYQDGRRNYNSFEL
jgi:hypothetical protein